jgi:hypothetical protein
MTDESGRVWKETVVAYSRHYPKICLKGLDKNTETSFGIVGVPTDIRTENLPSTNLDRYRYVNQFGWDAV